MIAALAVDIPEKENESIILSDCIKNFRRFIYQKRNWSNKKPNSHCRG